MLPVSPGSRIFGSCGVSEGNKTPRLEGCGNSPLGGSHQLGRDKKFFGAWACYYKQFVSAYSEHASPLNALTRKNTKFSWGAEQQSAFDYLKNALMSPPCLGTIRRSGRLIVDTDACDVAIGAVLHQEQDGEERVLGYYSKGLNNAQKNYCTTKKELLAIISTLDHWDTYLSCVSEPLFYVRTMQP